MPMCSRCKKNIAVVFITKIEGPDKTTQEGLCLKCARELGVKPLDNIMEQMGIPVQKIHAGHANMFLSPIFRETLAGVTGAIIELYDTDGSVGAAKGAGIGAGVYKDNNEAFATLEKLEVIEPDVAQRTAYDDAYARWKSNLERAMAAF